MKAFKPLKSMYIHNHRIYGDSILSTPQLRAYLKSKLRLHNLTFRDIKVLGKSETLLNYRVEYIGEMSAFVQAGNTTISTQAGSTQPV